MVPPPGPLFGMQPALPLPLSGAVMGIMAPQALAQMQHHHQQQQQLGIPMQQQQQQPQVRETGNNLHPLQTLNRKPLHLKLYTLSLYPKPQIF